MLFAPTLADRAILPTAWRGRYFFNRIGQKRTANLVSQSILCSPNEPTGLPFLLAIPLLFQRDRNTPNRTPQSVAGLQATTGISGSAAARAVSRSAIGG